MRNKGFVSMYLLGILAVCLLLSSGILAEVERYHDFEENRESFRETNWLEVLAVNRVKNKYRSYSEKNETLYLNGYSISFEYDDLLCTITITGNDVYRQRCLWYDDFDDQVVDYQ